MEYVRGSDVKLGRLEEVDMMDMLVVPEDIVALCAQTMSSTYGQSAENNFANVLSQGKVLKDNDRTPVYLCSQDMTMIYVTSKEKINKDYH